MRIDNLYLREVKMRRRLFLIGVLILTTILMVSSLGVCAKKTIRIGYAAPSLMDEGQVAIREGAYVTAKKFGWAFTTTDAERDASKQINQIESLLARGIDALVFVPVDSAALTVSVKKANKLGIPVITIDRKTTGGKLLLTVQSDNYLAGKQAGEYMVKLLKRKYGEPKGLVLELQGALGTNVAQLRGKGFNDVMAKYPDIKVISKPTNWYPDQGAAITEDILTAHPELDGIYWHSDCIGAGVVPALERLGKLKLIGEPDHIFLVGIDGTRVMLGYIREKKVDATMSQPLLDHGKVALEFLRAYFQGEEIPTSGLVIEPGALWSPAHIQMVNTGPLINLATTPVDLTNVDDSRLWGNMKKE